MDIRPMTQADLREVLAWAPKELSWRPVEDFLRHSFLVAVESGQVVGLGGIAKEAWTKNGWGLLMAATHPDHRNRGVHGVLVGARIAHIQLSCQEPLIFTSSRHPQRYERFGFQVIHTRSDGLSQLLRCVNV